MNPLLYHVVGPQGVGKTLVAEALVRDARAQGRRAVYVHEEEAYGKTASHLRGQFPQADLVVVEATELRAELHDHPQPADLFITLQRGKGWR